ncbi:MAG: hypothetical protein KGV59_04880 [Tenacibaculum sp.]|nr:hypothetical protein [Tenacibaculum sp.]
MMKYKKPEMVKSPKKLIKKVEVIYDGGVKSYSLAEITTVDNEKVVGIRWNSSYREQQNEEKKSGLKECVGVPFSSAKPIWFILPNDLFETRIKDYF